MNASKRHKQGSTAYLFLPLVAFNLGCMILWSKHLFLPLCLNVPSYSRIAQNEIHLPTRSFKREENLLDEQEDNPRIEEKFFLANFFSEASSSSNDLQLNDNLLALAKRVYPGMVFDRDEGGAAFLSTPSLVRHPETKKVVLGVRIIVEGARPMHSQNFLMLCTLAYPILESKCQDSGIHPRNVPLSCTDQHFLFPLRPSPSISIGPEDARLFINRQGNLGATFTMRGCHPGTEYNESSPSYGMATASWTRFEGIGESPTWRLQGNPKILDVRQPDGSIDANNYQAITKNWISLPPQPGPEEVKGNFTLCTGWTTNMAQNVVYKVSDIDHERDLYHVTPEQETTIFSVDHKHYRGSTNFVNYQGFLLSIWHYVDQVYGGYYLHFWHLMCPNPPYRTVATSGTFTLHRKMNRNERTSFALGLVVENSFAYISWSANDREIYLSRYSLNDIWTRLANEASYVGNGFDSSKNVSEICRLP